LFLELLHKLVTKTYCNANRIHIILDNYGIHSSLQVQLALQSEAAQKLQLHFLPPYCPDHNRIERIWKDLHDNVTRNHRCETMEQLMSEVRAYLAARNRSRRHTYARARVQGSAVGHADRVTIVHHPDVRRMLMLMRAQTEAARAVGYLTAASLDHARHARKADVRHVHELPLGLLTPIFKAWATELAQEVTSLGVQVHGGMGYIEDTGAAQHLRDARIATIYEGTTGIQAKDLVERKVLADGGRAARALLAEISSPQIEPAAESALGRIQKVLRDGVNATTAALDWVLQHATTEAHAASAVGVNLTLLFGTVLGGWQSSRAADAAQRRLQDGVGDPAFNRAKIATAQFYAEHVMPRAHALARTIVTGSSSIMALDEDQF